jgi:hypothetical protein
VTQGEADIRHKRWARGPWPHLNFYIILYLVLDIHQNNKKLLYSKLARSNENIVLR